MDTVNSSLWYYLAEGNQPNGPVGLERIQSLLQSGILNADSLVWKEGMEGWKPLAQTELAALLRGGQSMEHHKSRGRWDTSVKLEHLPTIALLLILFPFGVVKLWRENKFKLGEKALLSFMFGLFFLIMCDLLLQGREGMQHFSSHNSIDDPVAAIANSSPTSSPLPIQRFAVEASSSARGNWVAFSDEDGPAQVMAIREQELPQDILKSSVNELIEKLSGENRFLKFSSDVTVQLIGYSNRASGYAEVAVENSDGSAGRHLWISKNQLLEYVKTEPGSIVFRGSNARAFGDNNEILIASLSDAVEAFYEGSVSEADISKFIFMAGAQRNDDSVVEPEKVTGDYVIYQADFTNALSGRHVVDFAMPRSNGNDDPLGSGPVKISGSAMFTTETGVVRRVPVVVVIENSGRADVP